MSAVIPPQTSTRIVVATSPAPATSAQNSMTAEDPASEGESTLDSDTGGSYRPRDSAGKFMSDSAAAKPPKKEWRTRQMTMQKQAVTEADLRAMAQYRFERYKNWPSYITCKERWRGFAEREEVCPFNFAPLGPYDTTPLQPDSERHVRYDSGYPRLTTSTPRMPAGVLCSRGWQSRELMANVSYLTYTARSMLMTSRIACVCTRSARIFRGTVPPEDSR